MKGGMGLFKWPKNVEIALPEKIGNPGLFVGRKEEFDFFLGNWYMNLERNFTQNQAILSRRKKGKTSLMQRLFNILWSAGIEKKAEDLDVIPFYFSVRDSDQTLGMFATEFFIEFVKAYLSYQKKDRMLLIQSLSFDKLADLIEDKHLKELYKTMAGYVKEDNWHFMWKTASEAPALIGRLNGVKIVQIIDEFQYINEYIYDKDKKKLDRMSGTYMHVAEMREAPLIISGSEVHWLLNIVRSLTGRFQSYTLENLPEVEAKEAIERYAFFTETKITERAQEKIWELTRGDPLYIKALFLSRYNKEKDYTHDDNIIQVYEKEISEGEIYTTWMIYMLNTLCNFKEAKLPWTFHETEKSTDVVNKINSKRIMLYLFNEGKEKTRAEIIKALNLPYSDEEAEKKLNALIAGDLISKGSSGFRYQITNDKTYELVFRNVYQDEIDHFIPDIQKEIRKMMGRENVVKGKFAEFIIREKIKKPFNLKDLCEPEVDEQLIPKEITERGIIHLGLKKYEIDILVKCTKKREIWIDVKSTQNRYGKNELKRWLSIVNQAKELQKDILFMVYSENGFTKGTKESLIENGVFVVKQQRQNSL